MNKPVAWMMVERENGNAYFKMAEPTRDEKVSHHPYPLYTHPHPDNLGLALSIIDQQKLEIQALKQDNKELHAIAQRMAMAESDARKSLQNIKDYSVKELHLSLQKDKETGELLAVTYTDDEHRIVEVLWEKPPVKEEHFEGEPQAEELYEILQSNAELTDEEIMNVCITGGMYDCINDPYMQKDGKYSLDIDLIRFAKAILRKAQEK